MSISKRYDHLLRLLLIGETGVGKTCLLCRFATDDFVASHISTIGIDFKMKTMELDGQTVKVQIWDTAGQERFEAITKQFYRRAQGIMIVYDICSRKSFDAVPKWLSYIKEFCKDSIVISLIGNKSDKHDRRQVTYLEAQQLADDNDIDLFEVSAKDRNNLEKPFIDMCRDVLMSQQSQPDTDNTSIVMENALQTNLAPTDGSGDTSSIKTKTVSPPLEQQQGSWCCTIS